MPAELEPFFEFLRHASVSTDPAYAERVRACAQWLEQRLTAFGFRTAQHETPGHPIVLAHGPKKAGRPTVLIYGHYDVQPVDPVALWERPPFEPVVRDGLVVARGASDNKGQIWAHILGLAATLRETGDLPVNVVLLIEGEEEIGSPNLAPFLATHRHELACDVVVISDSSMVAPGVPTFTYGLRGIMAIEATVIGPDHDLHSGIFGGAVENPAAVLARLIASLHDRHRRVTIPGFYDGVRPLASWERRAWKKLPLQDDRLLQMTGAPALAGERKFSSLERLWARPTAEVNGITAGYQGEGTKTVLPSRASAKFTFRLVPDQDPAKIVAAVEAHFRALAPPTVKLELSPGHTGGSYLVDPKAGYGLAAQKALKKLLPRGKVALIREGGSIPIVADFKAILGVDTLLLGFCLPDCNAHSPNETFPVEHLDLGARLNRLLLAEIARSGVPAPATAAG
jgi:acetylornithine deacetylase/succinyl-diaminopimelate desuccinylase-like protein